MTDEEKMELEALRAEKHGQACAEFLRGISGKPGRGHQKAAARTDAHDDRPSAPAPQARHPAHSIRRKAG